MEEVQVQQEVKNQQREMTNKITTKDPKKVEASKRLSAHNHKKREEKKIEVSQYYSTGAVISVGVIGGLGYYLYKAKKGEVLSHNPTVSQQPRP